MSMWEQRPGSVPPPDRPVEAVLVPGQLTMRVHTHDLPVGADTLPCWTFVTNGFWALGQKEFVFTLVREPGADPARPPAEPFHFFTHVYSLAAQRQFVNAGGYTCLNPRRPFFGLMGMVGFVYTRPEYLAGIEMPPPDRCLTAVFLVPGEAELVQTGWGYRVLARLGRAAHYYPHPPWSDPRRAAVATPEERQVSLLGKMSMTSLNGAFARLPLLSPPAVGPVGEFRAGGPIGDRLTLRIQRTSLPRVREVLTRFAAGPEGAFALTFEADPDAEARLTWLPGETAPLPITSTTGSTRWVTGGFLALMFGDTVPEGGRVVEDGFAFAMRPPVWAQLRAALMNAEPLTLPAPGPKHLGLSVEWIEGE